MAKKHNVRKRSIAQQKPQRGPWTPHGTLPPMTPVSIWSREMQRERRLYRRHFIKNDIAYHGGDMDRPRYLKTREMRTESTERVWRWTQ